MDLDEVKAAWQVLDRRLEQQNNLHLREFRFARLREAQRALRPLCWGQGTQIGAGAALMLVFGPFWVAHRETFHVMLPGLLLHAYGLMFILFAVRALYLISRVDYAAPVLEVQSRLAELRDWRRRVEMPLFAVVGCFIWIPLILVIFNLFGADVWAHNPAYIYWNIACGFVCLGVLYIVMRWLRRSGKDSSFGGRSILNAQRELDEIALFENQ